MRELGAAIRRARKELGLHRNRVAELAGIPDNTLGKFERGVRTPSVENLLRICEALGRDPADLLRGLTSKSKTVPHASVTHQEGVEGVETAGSAPPGLKFVQQTRRQSDVGVRGPWIARGDEYAARGNWQRALHAYIQFERLLPSTDHLWARHVLERRAQMLINLNALAEAQNQITRVEASYQVPYLLQHGTVDERIQMLLNEKKSWKYTWEGNTETAIENCTEAFELALEFEGELSTRETSLHFLGRVRSERITTFMLFKELFPKLSLSEAHVRLIQLATEFFTRAESIDAQVGADLNIGFNRQWRARAFRALSGRPSMV